MPIQKEESPSVQSLRRGRFAAQERRDERPFGDADGERYRVTTEIVLADPGVDGVLVLLTPQAMTEPTACAEGVIAAARQAGGSKPVLACWMGENLVDAGRQRFAAAGIPHFTNPEGGVDAFGYLACYRRNQKALLQAPRTAVASTVSRTSTARD